MKTFFSFLLLLFFYLAAKAEHITGGEMFYTYVGFVNGQHQYRGTVKLFKNCFSNRPLADPAIVSVFDRVTGARIIDVTAPLSNPENISLTDPNKCITDPPDVCYTIGYYFFDLNLPASSNGYIISAQFVYRIAGINNLSNSYGNVGATYTAEIPATPQAANNSARFVGSDLVAVCANNSFSYSFGAKDTDGDELRYSFCQAYNGGGGGTMGSPSAPPPFISVPYGQGYDGNHPLGANVQIDSKTGFIKGIAPGEGVYVVTVCVEEIRNGVVIATQRKDLQINIASCSIAAASLLPEYLLCTTSSTLQLSNFSTSPLIKTYNWELSDNKDNIVFSESSQTVSYTFPDTGLYKIKLVINKGLECSDSMSSVARVYPGLKADFEYSGVCLTKPTVFTNKSTTVYGQINSWSWNFGEGSLDDPATQNANYLYQFAGTKRPQLIVNTTKGCKDTVTKTVNIVDKPPMTLAFRDTIICVNDQLPLLATAPGGGNFSWTPGYQISNANTSNPVVSPAVTTTYFVRLDDNGCINNDSVKVRVTDHVFLEAMKDTVICQNDPIQLTLKSDGLRYSWAPSEGIENAGLPNATTVTTTTTVYEVTAFIGSCSAKDQVIVTTVPYPKVNAGADTVICASTSAQLLGQTDGSSFTWSQVNSLSNINSLNPIARPTQTTTYVLTALDTRGCPKPSRDSVVVKVLPPVRAFAGRDTAVVIGQPLQLNAREGVGYRWSPSIGLSATDVNNPVAFYSSPSEGIKYKVLVLNEAGCADSAYITVKVFAADPIVFVPDAFTPNGDGKNDKLRPIAAGIVKIEYFNIYNRWGELVFSTTINGQGWDGTIAGQAQNTGAFVWAVKATDYNGKTFFQKGIVTLIR